MTISVIIAAYNAGKTISRSIKSVLSQTIPIDEIIVVDDGSADDTAEIVKNFPGVRYIYQNNKGPAAARNNGARIASGDYVAFLDSDDYWESAHLERLRSIFQINSNLQWAASAYRRQSVTGKEKVIRLKKRFYSPGFKVNYFSSTPKLHFLSVISTVVRRDFFISAGGFAEKYSRGEDLSLWLRLALSDPNLGYSPEPTAVYVTLPDSLTSRKGDNGWILQRINDDFAMVCSRPAELREKAWPVIRPWVWGIIKRGIREKDSYALASVSEIYGERLDLFQKLVLNTSRWIIRAL
jgi:glycosyltransferase involved in cell wall biosynthesis